MKQSFARIFGGAGAQDKKEEVVDVVVDNDVSISLAGTTAEALLEIPTVAIKPNRFQPRTVFNEEKINELAATLAQHGIIQPIVVRQMEDESDKYEIIAGERRWRAALKLGWEKIPAVINNLNDSDTAAIALIENLQREELTVIEEAVAYEKLIAIHELTQEGLALQLGVSQSTIANKLRLLKAPDFVQQALLEKKISERHARSMLTLDDIALQSQLLEEIIQKGLTVSQTEAQIKKLLSTGDDKKKTVRKVVSRDVRIAFNTIRQSLSMISDHGIDFSSNEEEFDEYYQVTIKIPKKK